MRLLHTPHETCEAQHIQKIKALSGGQRLSFIWNAPKGALLLELHIQHDIVEVAFTQVFARNKEVNNVF